METIYTNKLIEEKITNYIEMGRAVVNNHSFTTLNESKEWLEADLFYKCKGKIGDFWVYGFTHAMCEIGRDVSEIFLDSESFSDVSTILHKFNKGEHITVEAGLSISLTDYVRLFCLEAEHGLLPSSTPMRTREKGLISMHRRKDAVGDIIVNKGKGVFFDNVNIEIYYWKIQGYGLEESGPYVTLLSKGCDYMADGTGHLRSRLFHVYMVNEKPESFQAIIHNQLRKHLNPDTNHGRCMALRNRFFTLKSTSSKHNLPTMFDAWCVKVDKAVHVKIGMSFEISHKGSSKKVSVTDISRCNAESLYSGQYVGIVENCFNEVFLIV